jgi:hypothetical protein
MQLEKEQEAELSQEQKNLVASLSFKSLDEIDRYLISECTSQWRKVSRIAGHTFLKFSDPYPGIPDGFYFQRIHLLIKRGELVARGDLKQMRSVEVRLPSSSSRES